MPLTFDETKTYLEGILPIGDSFDGGAFHDSEQGLDVDGFKEIDWTWGREPDRFLSVGIRELGVDSDSNMVTIARLRK